MVGSQRLTLRRLTPLNPRGASVTHLAPPRPQITALSLNNANSNHLDRRDVRLMRRYSTAPEPSQNLNHLSVLSICPNCNRTIHGSRRLLEQPLHLTEASHPLLKKHKAIHPSGSQPPPQFWDTLSKIWLTKRALRAASPLCSPYPLPRGPVTRQSVAEWQRNHEPRQTVAGVLSDYKSWNFRDLKVFARHGGASHCHTL